MAPTPLLNIDLGELPDEPPELAALAGWVNVACGGHAGDDASMRETVRRAAGRIAAHPSWPDRPGFGRRSLALSPGSLRETVAAQCDALARVARAAGRGVDGVKPHGALYHDADRDPALAEALVAGAIDALGPGKALLGPPQGHLLAAARAAGMEPWREGFADRGLDAAGRLLPRGTPGALLATPEAAASQAAALLETGAFDTLCVHGDTPGAVAIARAVAGTLARYALADTGSIPVEAVGAALLYPLPPPLLVDGARRRGVIDALRALPDARDVALTDRVVGMWWEDDRGATQATDPIPAADRAQRVGALLSGLAGHRPPALRAHVFPTLYDGADLGSVARLLGVSPEALVRRHAEATWEVRFLGFLPGFAYLESPGWTWDLPRRAHPRPRVPPGAVALAGRRCGVYPIASPGGWNLIGRVVGVSLFDEALGARLGAGDRVRFVDAAAPGASPAPAARGA